MNIAKRYMQKPFLYKIIILYFITSILERIDFFKREGSFGLTPEVIGALLLLICCAFDIILSHGTYFISPELAEYIKIVLFLLLTVFISACFSADSLMSFKRMTLLIIYAVSGFLAINYILLYWKDNLKSIILKCTVAQCIIYMLFSAVDIIFWFNNSFQRSVQRFFPIYDARLTSIGSSFVRVRGASGDPNRAGIFLVVCIFIILRFSKPSFLRTTFFGAISIILLLTLSRTSILCLAILLVMNSLINIMTLKKVSAKTILPFIGLLIVAALILIVFLNSKFLSGFFDGLIGRFESKDQSANEHIELIVFGLQSAFSNGKIFLVGNGYGASSELLTAVFHTPASKSFNFHNGFISFLVECGAASCISFIYLIIKPLLKNKTLLPIISVIVLANIPYQFFSESYFWYVLPLIYALKDEKRLI